jgi:hypothetical protein
MMVSAWVQTQHKSNGLDWDLFAQWGGGHRVFIIEVKGRGAVIMNSKSQKTSHISPLFNLNISSLRRSVRKGNCIPNYTTTFSTGAMFLSFYEMTNLFSDFLNLRQEQSIPRNVPAPLQ